MSIDLIAKYFLNGNIVLGLIGLFIILYIIWIKPLVERNKLYENNISETLEKLKKSTPNNAILEDKIKDLSFEVKTLNNNLDNVIRLINGLEEYIQHVVNKLPSNVESNLKDTIDKVDKLNNLILKIRELNREEIRYLQNKDKTLQAMYVKISSIYNIVDKLEHIIKTIIIELKDKNLLEGKMENGEDIVVFLNKTKHESKIIENHVKDILIKSGLNPDDFVDNRLNKLFDED
jgi:hypothetical protein